MNKNFMFKGYTILDKRIYLFFIKIGLNMTQNIKNLLFSFYQLKTIDERMTFLQTSDLNTQIIKHILEYENNLEYIYSIIYNPNLKISNLLIAIKNILPFDYDINNINDTIQRMINLAKEDDDYNFILDILVNNTYIYTKSHIFFKNL